MARVYQKKYNPDGSVNSKYRSGGRNTKKGSLFDTAEFVAYDGEGAEIDGKHKYILFANSNGDVYMDSCNGLRTRELLSNMLEWSSKQTAPSINVCYGASYDCNMFLTDIPIDKLKELHEKGTVIWGEFKIEYRPRKVFIVRRIPKTGRWTYSKSKKQWSRRYNGTFILWDVLGFFQYSFVTAIQKYLPDYDAEKLRVIIEHKGQRDSFRAENSADILHYCRLELEALVAIMDKVREGITEAGLQVTRWDGAGAIAAAMLRKYDVKYSLNKEVPPEIKREAWRAYSGGRIELVRYGNFRSDLFPNGIWHGDINSAYPTVLRNLPDLANGEWKHVWNFIPNSYGLWRLTFTFPETREQIYPFFYRTYKGSIRIPARGSGTYWTPEVEAGLEFDKENVHIHDGWIWIPYTDHKPFAFIDEVYDMRKRWKREGNAAEKVAKLGMNSMYGKLAQQKVRESDSEPAWQQVEYAGYITSATRAALFRTAMQNPNEVIMFTTDGIFSMEPLEVDVGEGLGQWSVETHEEIVVVQSGIYWTKTDGKWNDYYRGFDRGSVQRETILDAWNAKQTVIEVPSRRFITLGTALAGGDSFSRWQQWPESQRKIKLNPRGTKRLEHSHYMFNGEPITDHQEYWNPAYLPQRTRAMHDEMASALEPSWIYKGNDTVNEEDSNRVGEWDYQE